jgi:type I restriction enzyme S subunit
MNKYTKYKNSGIEWLGDIPEHWSKRDTTRCINCAKQIVGENYLSHNVLSLSINGVIFRDMESGAGKHHSDMGTYQIIRPDSIVLCLFDMDVTPRIVGYSDKNGIITSAYTNISPKANTNSKYYYYYYLLQDYNNYLFSQGTGIRTTLTRSQFGALKIALPPKPEQTAIANFLDNKLEKIERFISKKKQLIKLLNEQKAAIINQAVTKGVPQGKDKACLVSTKPSGIEWLGDIPESWEVKKLKYIGKIINGYAFKSHWFKDKGVKVLKITNIQPMQIVWDETSYVDEKYYTELEHFRIKKNDLVFALTRPIIKAGIKAAFIKTDEKILINQRNAIFSLEDENTLTEWIYFVLLDKCFEKRFEKEIDFTNQQPNISSKDIENIEFPIPSLLEQTQIVKHIKTELTKINETITTIEKEITLVEEYKTALIAEAVTGKIDVTNYEL